MKTKVKGVNKTTVRTIIVSILVICFFVGIVILYYNMVYERERDKIILRGELSSVKAAQQYRSARSGRRSAQAASSVFSSSITTRD